MEQSSCLPSLIHRNACTIHAKDSPGVLQIIALCRKDNIHSQLHVSLMKLRPLILSSPCIEI